jgi:hypothetical protein
VPKSVSIPRRFNGPLDSGNGGYCAGVAAGLLGGPAEVTLRRPVPLDTELDVVRDGDGSVRMLAGEAPVLEATSRPDFQMEAPAPPGVEEARRGAERYRGAPDGIFSRCFVCGLAREDSFGVFAGEVSGRELVASPWTPPAWAAGPGGHALPEFVWAVLDCPTYFAAYLGGALSMSVLARITARIDAPAVAGEEHVVMAWPLGAEGRKRHAGAALASAEGQILAVGRALLIEPRADQGAAATRR